MGHTILLLYLKTYWYFITGRRRPALNRGLVNHVWLR